MCEKCNALDGKISRYRSFLAQDIDPLTTERLNDAVEEMLRLRRLQHKPGRPTSRAECICLRRSTRSPAMRLSSACGAATPRGTWPKGPMRGVRPYRIARF